jgi:hypothetical protein
MPRYNLRRPKAEQPFEFLKLSGEIRNAIYKFVVISSSPITPLKTIKKTVMFLPVYDRTHQTQPAITKVSRQLRSEALPLYYSENSFDFAWDFDNMPLPAFLRINTESLKHIRIIQVGWWGVCLKVMINLDSSDLEAFYSRVGCYGHTLEITDKDDEGMLERVQHDAEYTETDPLCGFHLLNIVRKFRGPKGPTMEYLLSRWPM